MAELLLPLSLLQRHGACELHRRVLEFQSVHDCLPNEDSTLREWLEVTPCMIDVMWAMRCLDSQGRLLALHTAVFAARRAYADQPNPDNREVLRIAEDVLSALWQGKTVPSSTVAESMDVSYSDAVSHTVYFAVRVAYFCLDSNFDNPTGVPSSVLASLYACDVARSGRDDDYEANGYIHDDSGPEQQAMRANFMEALDYIESGRVYELCNPSQSTS